MANISHWHNRSKAKEDLFFQLMARQDWERAEFEAKTDPLVAWNAATVDSFLGSSKPCKITPMHQASAYGAPLEPIEFLNRANPNFLLTRDSYYQRLPLHAAFIGDKYKTKPQILLKLIEYEKSTAMGKDILGRCPLHYSCHHNVPSGVIETLIQAFPGAAKIADVHGWLPIHVACRSNTPISVAEMLLEIYPESIHKKTDKGSTPLDCAKKVKNEDLIKLLTEATSRCKPFSEENQDHVDESLLMQNASKFTDLHDAANGIMGLGAAEFLHLPDHRLHDEDDRPDSPTGDERDHHQPIPQQKIDPSHLALSPTSPYMCDKKPKIPFVGVEKVDLE